jgi:murein DD-endopeptidase MepM/ murein hydrolase activator NlpD
MPKYFYIFILSLIALFSANVFADTSLSVDQLKQQIDDRNNQIQQLEAEINQFNGQLDVVNSQSKTLQSTLKTLDLTQKKISADLSLTDQKIGKTQLTITQISDQINATQNNIDINKKSLYSLIRAMSDNDDKSVLETILAGKNIGDIWTDIDSLATIQNEIKTKSDELQTLNADLKSKQIANQNQQKQLTTLKQDLSGKNQAVLQTKQEKAALLTQTKNQETAFQNLINIKKTQEAQFENDIYNFESQLNIAVNPNSYPAAQHGILSWPLDNVFITQLFGKTVGADRLYASGSHNGVDFRASIGTRVKAVLSGTVVGTGNTDIYPGCYSFGKWVMIKHENGLSTIYGHLSVISVSQGQSLSTGDLVGYSGNTGYTTGPHLHISVYASVGVRIEQYVNSRGCKQAVIPLADTKAYLDPMLYFPQYP